MKAYTELRLTNPKSYRAVVQQGHQYFTIGTGEKEHCDFLVKMFEIALAAHDAAVAQLAERLPCKQDVGSAILSSGSKYKSPFCQSGPDCKICAVEAGLQDKTYWLFGPWR